MNSPSVTNKRSIIVVGLALVLPMAIGVLTAVASQVEVRSVYSGWNTGSAGPSSGQWCYGSLHTYSWWHGVAYSADVNTGTRTMTVNYVDFYGGGTNPNPVYLPNQVWGPDSWVVGNNPNHSYRFGALSAWNQQSFYSYDITLWLYRTLTYASGGNVYVQAQLGASDGSGGIDQQCFGYSYLVLDPPN